MGSSGWKLKNSARNMMMVWIPAVAGMTREKSVEVTIRKSDILVTHP